MRWELLETTLSGNRHHTEMGSKLSAQSDASVRLESGKLHEADVWWNTKESSKIQESLVAYKRF